MTKISMTFADVDLRPLLTVLKVVRHIGNERHISSTDNRYIGISVNRLFIHPKIIDVTFSIASQSMNYKFIDTNERVTTTKTSLNHLKRQIANIFNVTEPKKLSFSDDTNIFYYAMPTGSIEVEDINEWYAVCKMTFTVVDGLAHSKILKTFKSNGNRLSVINNGGTVVAPKLEFISAGNLKMIAFTLENNVFKIGKTTGDDVISSGQSVAIDMSEGTILIGGNRRIYRSFDSRLIHLPVGTSNIGIAVNSGATVPIVSAKFNEVFL